MNCPSVCDGLFDNADSIEIMKRLNKSKEMSYRKYVSTEISKNE